MKYFLICEFNFNSSTKINGKSAHKGECRTFQLVHNLMNKLFISLCLGNNQNTLKNIMEKYFQNVAQKVHHDKIWMLLWPIYSKFQPKYKVITVS